MNLGYIDKFRAFDFLPSRSPLSLISLAYLKCITRDTCISHITKNNNIFAALNIDLINSAKVFTGISKVLLEPMSLKVLGTHRKSDNCRKKIHI